MLDIIADPKLNISELYNMAGRKANVMLACIKRGIFSKSQEVRILLDSVLITSYFKHYIISEHHILRAQTGTILDKTMRLRGLEQRAATSSPSLKVAHIHLFLMIFFIIGLKF